MTDRLALNRILSTGCCLLVAVVAVLAVFPSPVDGQVVPQPRTGAPISGLSKEERARFDAGKVAFTRLFTQEEGLGPTFNNDGCGVCHSGGGAGGAGTITVTRFALITKEDEWFGFEDEGGTLLQSTSFEDDCSEVVPAEATILATRLTNSAFGAGLVEGIPDADLESLEADGSGVSGRVHWVQPLEDPTGPLRAGRFGWKAQVATVLTFSGDASLNEMGITNRLVPTETAANGDLERLAMCDGVDDPEDVADDDGIAFIDRITDFQRFLAPPPQTPRSGMLGEQIFIDIGCAGCHIATPFVTGAAAEKALSGVSFQPYSDFLLHDMGSLGDFIIQGDAGLTEFRTPSLWGLRQRPKLLHNGDAGSPVFAERVDEAIRAHDGEALDSAVAYDALSHEEEKTLFGFLGSLGRREFDHDGNNVIDQSDFVEMLACHRAGLEVNPDDACAVSDIDQDGDVDNDDFEAFLTVYEAELFDCDADGVSDLEDLFVNGSPDCNENLVPDACDPGTGKNGVPAECETFLRGDSNGDGDAGFVDVIHLLHAMFLEQRTLGCMDAVDINDSARLDLVDPIYMLNYLFQEAAAPLAPFPDCGFDPSSDALECDSPTTCTGP